MNMRPMPADPAELRQAYASFPSGVTALCGCVDGKPTGMAVSSFTSVSLEPPLVSVYVQKNSKTWLQLRGLPRLGISVMAEDQGPVCRLLAGPGDRFQGIAWNRTLEGAVFVDGATAWFDCSIYQEIEAGDHIIVLLQIEAIRSDRSRQPLVFHHSQMRRLASV